MGTEVTVGIDIGTSSVKAIAADGDGNVVARSRVAAPGARCRRRSASSTTPPPRGATARADALAELGDLDVRGVSVAAMVPSLTAVDEQGTPRHPRPALRRRARPHRRIGRRRRRHRRRVGRIPRLRALAARERAGARTASGPRRRWPTTRCAARRCSTPPPRALAHPLVRLRPGGTSSGRGRARDHAPAQLPRLVPTGLGGGPRRWRRARARVGLHRRDGRAARGRRRPGRATCSCSSAPR